jgi:hypothetical protein
MFRKRRMLLGFILILGLTLSLTGVAGADNQRGTTLSAEKTAEGLWTREFGWTIDKSVDPESWDLFTGDSGTSEYTITVTKDSGTDTIGVEGEICVTNGGSFPTEGLTIIDTVQYKTGSGQFQDLVSAAVDTSAKPVLGGIEEYPPGGETYCYPYEIDFTPVAGAQYRNVAHVTITNHAGWIPGGNNCPGPDVCPFGPDPKVGFDLPSSPTLINDSINVDDTNGGSWPFNGDGSASYDKKFMCDEKGEKDYDNTATIRETGDDDSARVVVTCHELDVTKDAPTSFDRTYHWSIDKSADQSSLTLALNQSFLVNYAVVVDMTGYTDSNWAVEGSIYVDNPAPIDATINGVEDVITGIVGPIDVKCGVTFPYLLEAGTTLTCTYDADLPDATTRTNTATATLQNYDYASDGSATLGGTTDFSGTAGVSFGSAVMTQIDECIAVVDSYAGTLGPVYHGVALPKTFTYPRTVGPYATCGDYTVDNVAAFSTLDTLTTGSDSWRVNVNIPCGGCTLTIGYWKTHAGFGPQADMVTPLLPKRLGLPIGPKTIYVNNAGMAVQLLSFRGSNNVFDASNGINKLYAQLLGAKLNIASGANGSAVSSTILAADLFLSTRDSTNWAGLTKIQKNQVLAWMTILDGFNNGYTGPGHCSQ